MAAFGSHSLEADGSIKSGFAQFLVKPPKADYEFDYGTSTIRVLQNSPLIVCLSKGAQSHEQALDEGSKNVQEALDLLSIKCGEHLATTDVNQEYIVWWQENGLKKLALVTSGSLPIFLGQRPQFLGPIHPHNPGFRYYRISQVSDDLFEAFRYMYLAFEFFISFKHPKTNKREKEWLEDALNKEAPDLDLAGIYPFSLNPVGNFISSVYDFSRTHLFHAKNGRNFLVPRVISQDQKQVYDALTNLTLVVNKMLGLWYNMEPPRRKISFDALKSATRGTFVSPKFVLYYRDDFSVDASLLDVCQKGSIEIPVTLVEEFLGQDKFHLYGSIKTKSFKTDTPIKAFYIIDSQQVLAVHSLKAAMDIAGIDVLEFLFFFQAISGTGPKNTFLT